jgi:hypothetical protein
MDKPGDKSRNRPVGDVSFHVAKANDAGVVDGQRGVGRLAKGRQERFPYDQPTIELVTVSEREQETFRRRI